jgi:hypothetical protein
VAIIGTRSLTRTHAKGAFHCPGCWAQQTYRHRRVQRFYHLLFVPLIPWGQMGEYVECDACQTTYDLAVLGFDPGPEQAEFEAEFEAAIKRVMVLMMLADDVLHPAEVLTICDVFARITTGELTEAEVLAEADAARAMGLDLETFVQGLVGRLNYKGKDMVMRAAFLVAAADGEFQGPEKALLNQLGRALQMNPAYITGVLESATAPD